MNKRVLEIICYVIGAISILVGLISVSVGGIVFILFGLVFLWLGYRFKKSVVAPVKKSKPAARMREPVFVNPGSKVYHTNERCPFIKNSYEIIDLTEAVNRGLKECKHCTK